MTSLHKHRFLRLFMGGLITLLITQLLFGALVISALYKQYQEPILQLNGLLCKDMADHLGLLVRVGKSLRPSTLERFFAPFHGHTNVSNLVVASTDSEVIYQWEKVEKSELDIPKNAKNVFGSVRKFDTDQNFWTACPVLDKKGNTVSTVYVSIDKDSVLQTVYKAAQSQLIIFGVIMLAEGIMLAAMLYGLSRRKSEKDKHFSLYLRASIMLPLIVGQLAFLALLISPLTKLYEETSFKTGYQVARQISWDLERLVARGMSISDIKTMDSWLISRQQFVSTLGIAVHDSRGRVHSATDRSTMLSRDQWETIRSSSAVAHRDILDKETGDFAGSVSVSIDPSVAKRELRTVMLDNLTLMFVGVLFLAELIYLLLMSGGGVHTMVHKPEFMRPVIFACLFGTEMSMSYVPIRIGELGFDLFGLPPDVVSGLPVSCELFMAGAAMLIGGFWSQRSGWRPMLVAGIALASCGSMLSWFSGGPLPFILSRGVAGLGYGFINLSAQIFVIAHSPETHRARNLAFMFAGLYAGTLSGSALGGLVADRLGYAAVFPFSAVLLLILAAMLWRSLPIECWIPETRTERFSLNESLKFIADRRMGSLLAFFIIPNALITVCLFQFFVPVSLNQAGISAADIGRVFLVYCVIVMFAGPAFGTLTDKAKKMENPLFLSLLIAAASVASLLVFEGLTGAMICVSLLAVNTAITSNGQGAYALSLPAALSFGKSRTMGFYNVAMRLGQVLGPLSLGVMMSVWDVRIGLTSLAIFTLVSAFLFLALSWRDRSARR